MYVRFSRSLLDSDDAQFLQSGVSEVIYYVDKRIGNSDAAYIASHKLLFMAGVKVLLVVDLYVKM